MTSIGPQIPEHLLEQRQSNNKGSEGVADEAESKLEKSSSVTVGPQIPARLSKPSTPSQSEEDEEDDYGPALPPGLLAKRSGSTSASTKSGTAARSPSTLGPRRVVGPSLPGHDRQLHYGDEEYEDDDVGPMPLPEAVGKSDSMSEGVREFIEKEERRKKEVEEAAKPKKLQREEWMLVPPSSSDLLGHLGDPTKLKARQFSRGGGAASRSTPNNLWTETPAERQQRIADEVAGKKRRAANADDDVSDDRDTERKKQRDLELRKIVEEHNKSSRGKSLLQMHEVEKKKEKKNKGEDEEPPAIWDHARDMSLGGRLMDEKQRSKLISDSRSLGDRFGAGKSGGYL